MCVCNYKCLYNIKGTHLKYAYIVILYMYMHTCSYVYIPVCTHMHVIVSTSYNTRCGVQNWGHIFPLVINQFTYEPYITYIFMYVFIKKIYFKYLLIKKIDCGRKQAKRIFIFSNEYFFIIRFYFKLQITNSKIIKCYIKFFSLCFPSL